MSRIDEAFKRAAGEGAHRAPLRDDEQAAPEAPLFTYPLEAKYAEPREDRRPPSAPIVAARPADVRGGVACAPAVDGKLVTRAVPPAFVEQFSRLAAILHEAQVERGLKTVMVSSALPGEGKTLTITNLALTLSELYKRRVLLVDADLRRPNVHEILQIPNAAGLAEALRSPRASLPLVQVTQYLTVLPAGQADHRPMAALTSDRVQRILTDAGAGHDWILIDTPPAVLLPDAQLLARFTDGVLLVIAAGRTPYAQVTRAVSAFGPERLLGTILNRADALSTPANAYYQHYYTAGNHGDR